MKPIILTIALFISALSCFCQLNPELVKKMEDFKGDIARIGGKAEVSIEKIHREQVLVVNLSFPKPHPLESADEKHVFDYIGIDSGKEDEAMFDYVGAEALTVIQKEKDIIKAKVKLAYAGYRSFERCYRAITPNRLDYCSPLTVNDLSGGNPIRVKYVFTGIIPLAKSY